MKEIPPVLIVDDDSQMRSALREAVSMLGYPVEVTDNGRSAIDKLQSSTCSMVITDMRMPGMDGIALIKEIRKLSLNIPILVITGYGTVENAVLAMKSGATDYLMKPFSYETLHQAIESILSRNGGCSTSPPIKDGNTIVTPLTDNPEMKKIISIAENLAMSDITVLITGESGTGKELLARYIYQRSNRAKGPFVAVNCAAIPENLLESELFGYEKGAFTGAHERRKGKFELAHGGVLLLDEISEMPLHLQAKLLRVLQEKTVDRIGGTKPVPVDVRVIATTNRDLLKEIREGRFREDLYYRLNVFPIKLPPLRERPEDIPLLSRWFLERYSASHKKSIKGISNSAMEILKKRPWKGNVRELENVIQRAVFLCQGDTIEPEDLVFEEPEVSLKCGKIRDLEKELILKTLEETKGNKTLAAKILGVSVRTIRNKLAQYRQEFPQGKNIPCFRSTDH
jgi:DNA-binding NtrC family response regulator